MLDWRWEYHTSYYLQQYNNIKSSSIFIAVIEIHFGTLSLYSLILKRKLSWTGIAICLQARLKEEIILEFGFWEDPTTPQLEQFTVLNC